MSILKARTQLLRDEHHSHTGLTFVTGNESNMHYRKIPKYLDTQKMAEYPKNWTMWIYHRVLCPNNRQNGKPCRPWSDCSSRSSLIWVYTVYLDLSVGKLMTIAEPTNFLNYKIGYLSGPTNLISFKLVLRTRLTVGHLNRICIFTAFHWYKCSIKNFFVGVGFYVMLMVGIAKTCIQIQQSI